MFDNFFLYKIYLKFFLWRSARSFDRVASDSNFDFVSRDKLIQLVLARKKGGGVLHIIGSGRSLNDSCRVISSEDFVVGFNYAALSDIHFDLYFFEFGGFKVDSISKKHFSLFKDVVSQQTDCVFFKNIWEGKNDLSYIKESWAFNVRYTKDRIYPSGSLKYLPYTVKLFFEDDSVYLPQLSSSVMVCLYLAYKLGFKKIVIHGLDFGGAYFYDELVSSCKKIYMPSEEGEGHYFNSGVSSIHPTAAGEFGMKEIIIASSNYLRSKGVLVYSGADSSPSSEFLPVYSLVDK